MLLLKHRIHIVESRSDSLACGNVPALDVSGTPTERCLHAYESPYAPVRLTGWLAPAGHERAGG